MRYRGSLSNLVVDGHFRQRIQYSMDLRSTCANFAYLTLSFSSTGQMTFDELLELADRGDHRAVDMLVKDIYGGAYESLGLSADVIASSFGLAARRPNETRRPADMVKALLVAICK